MMMMKSRKPMEYTICIVKKKTTTTEISILITIITKLIFFVQNHPKIIEKTKKQIFFLKYTEEKGKQNSKKTYE